MELNEKLEILMKQKNIKNLNQLSQGADIPYNTLKDIVDGNVDIRLSTSRKICNFLDITLDELLDNNVNLNFKRFDVTGLDSNDIKMTEKYIKFLKYSKKND